MPSKLKLLLLLSAVASQAQQPLAPPRTPDALAMGSSMGFGVAYPIIKHEPYTAVVHTMEVQPQPSGTQIVHETFNIHTRDAGGRLRDEQLSAPMDRNGGSVLSMVTVFDPTAALQTQWDNEAKTMFTSAIPISCCRNQHPAPICAANPAFAPERDSVQYQSLGEQAIQGV